MFPSYFGAQPAQEPTEQGTAKAQPVGVDATEPGITDAATYYTPYEGERSIKGVILHSADGSSADADLNTLSTGDPDHKVSAHYYVERDGTVHHLVADNDIAWHAGATSGQYADYNNNSTIGIETQHVDGKQDWPDAQVRSEAHIAARIIQQHPGMTVNDVLGHNDIAGERKQDPKDFPWNDFRGYVQQELAGSGGTVPRARPAAQQGSGLYDFEDPQDFVTGQATTFGNKADIESGQDSGVGAPRLGSIPTTDVYGAAVPEWVLRSRLGNSPAAWRRARLDVVDPSSGNRLRVPIVDIGPSASQEDKGIVADFTPGVDKYFNNQGGGKNLMFRLVKNGGPDVNSDTPEWNNEQAAIASGVDVGQTAKAAQIYPAKQRGGAAVPATTVPWTVQWLTDAEVEGARQATQQQKLEALPDEMATLNDLEQQNPNPAAMMKVLSHRIDGVSDDTRQDFANNLKVEVTQEAQKFYNEPDADKAYARAMSQAGPLELGSDFWHKIIAGAQEYQLPMAQAGPYGTAKNDVNSFFGKTGITSAADQHAFLTKLYTMPYDEREKAIADVLPPTIPGVTPDLGPSTNPAYLARAVDKLADPKFEQQQNQEIARIKENVSKNLQTDPRLKGTLVGDASSMIGQSVADMATLATPALWPVFAAKISNQIQDQIKQEHPDWSEDQIQKQATYGTLVATLGQVGAGHIFGAVAEPLLNWIEQPVLRALAKIGAGGAAGTALTGGGQAAVNIATGQPIGQGVAQAAVTGGLMGVGGAILHGPGEYIPRETKPVEVAPEPPPTTPAEPLPTEPQQPPPAGEAQPPVQPAPVVGKPAGQESYIDPDRVTKRVASDEIHWVPADEVDQRWNTPDNKSFYIPPGGTENTIGQSYPNAIKSVSGESPMHAPEASVGEDGSVQFIDGRHRFAAMRDFGYTQVPLALDADSAENARATGLVTQEPTPPHAEKPPNALPTEPAPLEQGTDKYVSSIANRFVQQKVEAGQIGEIAPGQGYATKDLIAAGLRMSPEEVTQHISDLENGVGNQKEQAAAVRAREAMLGQQSAQASKIAEANPNDAQAQAQARDARQTVTDFHNGPVAALKNNWHAAGMAMQGEHEVDLSTFNGQWENWMRNNEGKPPPSALEPELRASATRAKKVVDAEKVAAKAFSDEVGKPTKMKIPSADEVRTQIMEQMGIGPCIT
jgi:hypothetical protein